ncbi:MAG: hypothetical protein CFE33_08070 [Pseudorhodobacter sp. PARRP1]|nr:MAG: hypothetical protein CFE33_08070 [Pseudorhodobacter sp. PARRP1]
MRLEIDTTFDVYSDARGRDPDIYSATLRRYHKILWSKPLPSGKRFDLSDKKPGDYLYHQSQLGEFALSSDSLGHTYRYVRAMGAIIAQVSAADLDKFFATCSTVGAYIVFPARKIEGKLTINAGRGLNSRIRDRFDLTLECIRRHYLNEESPLSAILGRYADFFALFTNFQGYVDFFLLQDLASEDYSSIKFLLPFYSFDCSPLPSNVADYLLYRDRMTTFVEARNQRINQQAEQLAYSDSPQ